MEKLMLLSSDAGACAGDGCACCSAGLSGAVGEERTERDRYTEDPDRQQGRAGQPVHGAFTSYQRYQHR